MGADTATGPAAGDGKPPRDPRAERAALAGRAGSGRRGAQLGAHYARVFGEATSGHNRVWLLRRIAWRIQALAEGGLSERARRRAAELARDADLRSTPPAAARGARAAAPGA